MVQTEREAAPQSAKAFVRTCAAYERAGTQDQPQLPEKIIAAAATELVERAVRAAVKVLTELPLNFFVC